MQLPHCLWPPHLPAQRAEAPRSPAASARASHRAISQHLAPRERWQSRLWADKPSPSTSRWELRQHQAQSEEPNINSGDGLLPTATGTDLSSSLHAAKAGPGLREKSDQFLCHTQSACSSLICQPSGYPEFMMAPARQRTRRCLLLLLPPTPKSSHISSEEGPIKKIMSAAKDTACYRQRTWQKPLLFCPKAAAGLQLLPPGELS